MPGGGRHGLRPISRLMERVVIDHDAGCWLVESPLCSGGYVSINVGSKTGVRGHRYVYEFFKGSIPEGLVIDHLCRRRNCINPEHLEPVTQRENVRRGDLYLGDSCRKGHPFTEENLIVRVTAEGYIGRTCRICRRENDRQARARKRATVKPLAS